ncbi:MAG: hypothetical protein Q7O66_22610 [Dehalococcoidia bacterium]|nr:hypothetical protein [Dehalococcoidia bacterium]
MPESYKHFVPHSGLSIERYTESVPKDGKYYLLRNGEITNAFRSLKLAEQRFREMLKELDYTPQPVDPATRTQGEMHIDRYMDAKDMYWATSHMHKSRGGRGGRGGV